MRNRLSLIFCLLIQAANEGKLEFVKWLIDSGATVNMTMGSGWTALHAASMNGKKEVCMHIEDVHTIAYFTQFYPIS